MFCGKCGYEIQDGSSYCGVCGTSVNLMETAPLQDISQVTPAPLTASPQPALGGNFINEYHCKCRSCGSEWCFTDSDMEANKKVKVGAYLNAASAGLNAADGHAIGGAMWANRADTLASSVRDFSRCPTCGSHDFAVETSQVSNPFLNKTGASANASGKYKSKLTAGLLAIFLGAFGAHKFYLGYTKQAVIALIVSLCGVLLIVPTAIMAILGVIEGIIYLTKRDADFQETYVYGKKAWL